MTYPDGANRFDGIDFDNGAKSVGTEPFGTSSMGQLRLDVQSVSSVLRLASAEEDGPRRDRGERGGAGHRQLSNCQTVSVRNQ